MNIQNILKNHKWSDQIIHEEENERDEEDRKYRERQNKLRQEERDKKQKEYQNKIDAFIQKNGPYWHYAEADTYVELNKYSAVPCIDRANQVRACFMFGVGDELQIMHTLVGVHKEPYTVGEYHDTFCDKKNHNGKEIWVYRGR